MAFFVILFLMAALCLMLRRDYVLGLAFGVLLCVTLTTCLRIRTPGSMPELTIQRLVLFCLFIAWLVRGGWSMRWREIPLFRPLAFWIGACFLSLLFTEVDFVVSLKRFLDYALEIGLFFLVIMTSLRTPRDVIKILHAVCLGLVIVAFFAILEKKTGFNPVDYFLPEYARSAELRRNIVSTYATRILLGVAMAMGFACGAAILFLGNRSRHGRFWLWIAIAMFLTSCYFARSRGPWIALAGGGLVLLALGSPRVRWRLALLGTLVFIGFAANPGVWGSFSGLLETTLQADSHKAGTFKYRLELWTIAADQISQSPTKLLFGMGLGSGREVDLTWDLSYRKRSQQIISWDNHYAYDLFQSGILGFVASLYLSISIAWTLFQCWRRAKAPLRDVQAAILSGVLMLLFMKTNVLIFAKQLDYLFWSLVASAIAFDRFSIQWLPERAPIPVSAYQDDESHRWPDEVPQLN